MVAEKSKKSSGASKSKARSATRKAAAKKATTKVKKAAAKKAVSKKVKAMQTPSKAAEKKSPRKKAAKKSARLKDEKAVLNRAEVDLSFIGSKEESADSRNVESRARVRTELDTQVEAFLKSGGKIESIAPNVMGDPPKKPESNYGSRPI